MKEKPHKLDPLDKLIAEVQGVHTSDLVPEPDGAASVSFINSPERAAASFAVDLIREPGRVLLWYKTIHNVPGEGQTFSGWMSHKIVVSTLLSTLEPKQRENKIIEIALPQGIGQFPKILYAFEWFDPRSKKAFRQEIKDGFVRG